MRNQLPEFAQFIIANGLRQIREGQTSEQVLEIMEGTAIRYDARNWRVAQQLIRQAEERRNSNV